MVGAAVVFMQMCCALPQMILLYHGRDKILPDWPFSLGRLGSTVTKENMNYVVVVIAGFTGIISALCLPKRGTFKGPRVPDEHMSETVEVHQVK